MTGLHGSPGDKPALADRPPARFRKVVVAGGHLIDRPDRPQERFPPRKEGAVRARMADQLEEWGIGAGDLAICGGACGTDILFAELSVQRGAEVWLFLALPEEEFLEESVRPAGSGWETRFLALRGHPSVKTFQQSGQPESRPTGSLAYSLNNLRMIEAARAEAGDQRKLYALLVWDEKPAGDGPGGTSDLAAAVIRSGGWLAFVINPTRLCCPVKARS